MTNRLVTAFFLQVLLLPALATGEASPVLVLKTGTALPNVNGRMDHVGVEVNGKRLFATAIDNHTVEAIDLKAGKQVHAIADLDRPQGAFYDAPTNRLFVTCGGDGTVKIFAGTAIRLLQTIKLSADVDNVRYDARRQRVLVGYSGEKFLPGKSIRGQGDGALAFLDSTGKKIREIPVDAHPESFQLQKSGTRVFVNVPDKKEIQVADLATVRLLAHWPVTTCTDNFPMTLDETHHRLFVGCGIPASLLVFNAENGKMVTSLAAVGSDGGFYDASKV